MIGQTISQYSIFEKLGSGGMGVVYKAEDLKLKRTVALKFLPSELTRDPEAKQRFTHEAQAASGLQHNNICTIHDIDETDDGRLFIVMDCYEGEPLKEKIACGQVKLEEALDVAAQVAGGLSKAHEKGVVHRDIKPANIFITSDGVAKILDFGLAKLAGQSRLTKAGSTMGTAAYMSPEQARGEGVDARTDIWSLGVVLYEMLAGRPPFHADYEQAVLYKILNDNPEPISTFRQDVPKEVENIITKALAKDPRDRYQRMDKMLDEMIAAGEQLEKPALRQPKSRTRKAMLIAAGIVILIGLALGIEVLHFPPTEPPRTITSIAVLPLANISGKPEDDYFSDSMTEALISELSKIRSLRVISRTSVMRYRRTNKAIPEIARELNVDAVVEGSVMRSGEQIRISAQLIQAEPEQHLWVSTYDRDLQNVLKLQSDVAQAIAREIRVALLPEKVSPMWNRQ